MPGIGPYDHVRAQTDAEIPPGIYRVVGTDTETATLIRITDETCRHEYTGEVVTLSKETISERFEAGENPDAGLAFRDILAPLITISKALAYWIRNRLP